MILPARSEALQVSAGCDSSAAASLPQVRSVPIRKDDEVTVVRGTYKVRLFRQRALAGALQGFQRLRQAAAWLAAGPGRLQPGCGCAESGRLGAGTQSGAAQLKQRRRERAQRGWQSSTRPGASRPSRAVERQQKHPAQLCHSSASWRPASRTQQVVVIQLQALILSVLRCAMPAGA